MKNAMVVVATVALLVSAAVAQNNRTLPLSIAGNAGSGGALVLVSARAQLSGRPSKPFFCSLKSCLYYAGDNDTTDPGTNGLFDINNVGSGVWADVWVGVKPTKNATVSGVSGNYYNNATGIGTNPTPFVVRTGVSSGNGGKVVCNTSGNAMFGAYGESWSGLNSDNYRIKQVKQSCKFRKGKMYFILLEPQYNDTNTVGYLEDDNGLHAHHSGWPEVVDDSFFTWEEPPFYEPTWGQSGVCGGIGCDGFSMSLTGKQ
jgi:hypothetical protein